MKPDFVKRAQTLVRDPQFRTTNIRTRGFWNWLSNAEQLLEDLANQQAPAKPPQQPPQHHIDGYL